MTAFTLPVSCPECGGPVSLVNSRATGAVSIAILECRPCEWEYEFLARIGRHHRSESWTERQNQLRQESKRRAREMAHAT